MHRQIGCLVGLLLGSAAEAVICVPDAVPAATVLIPWFGVNPTVCTTPGGFRTLAQISNVSDAPVAVALTYWSNAAIPVRRETLTLAAGASRAIDIVTTVCAPALRDELLGVPAGGMCKAVAGDVGLIEGYITADVVTTTSGLPALTDPAFFGPPWLAMTNALTGSFTLVESVNNLATGFPAAAIEASPGTFGSSDVTFYGRYNPARTDAREPLPTAYINTYQSISTNDFSRVIVWRETDSALAAFNCGSGPAWHPLDVFGNSSGGFHRAHVLISEAGNGGPVPIWNLFARATQFNLLSVRNIGTGPRYDGNFFANFQHAGTAYGPGRFGQAWMASQHLSSGRFDFGTAALALDSSCTQGPTNYAAPTRFSGTP